MRFTCWKYLEFVPPGVVYKLELLDVFWSGTLSRVDKGILGNYSFRIPYFEAAILLCGSTFLQMRIVFAQRLPHLGW